MFNAHLVNDPFGDPAAYIEFMYRNEAVLFDLGDLHALPTRKILKVSHIFISHTHMDHFIGFDHLLRICLGRDQHVRLFGPPGFVQKVEHKIAAYSWNLVENYTNDFVIFAADVGPHGTMTARRYRCRTAFAPEPLEPQECNDGWIHVGSNYFRMRCVSLDHKIPSLAYRLEEKQHVNIMKTALEQLNLPVGPWLTELKEAILGKEPDDKAVKIWTREKGERVELATLPLGMLRNKAVKITPGERIAYVADALYSRENAERIVEIAADADHLFIESCFLADDSTRANDKYHLTARDAGRLAREARVKRITLFHFSPKYQGKGELLVQEAMKEFTGG